MGPRTHQHIAYVCSMYCRVVLLVGNLVTEEAVGPSPQLQPASPIQFEVHVLAPDNLPRSKTGGAFTPDRFGSFCC